MEIEFTKTGGIAMVILNRSGKLNEDQSMKLAIDACRVALGRAAGS
jgi:hypothetical protein